MSLTNFSEDQQFNPVDVVEHMAATHDWSFARDMKTRLALITLGNVCTLPRAISFGNAGPKRWAVLKETRRPALARRYVSASDIKALGTRRTAAPSTKPRLREVS